MDLKGKLQILLNKLSAGQYDEVIFEAMHLSKKFNVSGPYPADSIFYDAINDKHDVVVGSQNMRM